MSSYPQHWAERCICCIRAASHIPIIVVSGHVTAKEVDLGMAGVAAVLSKPVSMPHLEETIRSLLGLDSVACLSPKRAGRS